MRTLETFVLAALAATVVATAVSPAWAQANLNDPTRKARGDYGQITGNAYRPHTARSYQQSARQHADVLRHYGKNYQTVPKETAQEHAAEVKRSIAAAEKEFAKVGDLAKVDPEVAKSIKIIQDHHAKALELCKMVETEGANDITKPEKFHDCCDRMVKELDAAQVEHEKLMKLLKLPALEHPAPATK